MSGLVPRKMGSTEIEPSSSSSSSSDDKHPSQFLFFCVFLRFFEQRIFFLKKDMGSSSSRITESDIRHTFESKSKDCPTASSAVDGEVSMVIVLHRHGARFPTKEMSGDLSWPSDDAFWVGFLFVSLPRIVIQFRMNDAGFVRWKSHASGIDASIRIGM